jgi:predicted HicB family RNase H-like nuclease
VKTERQPGKPVVYPVMMPYELHQAAVNAAHDARKPLREFILDALKEALNAGKQRS